MRVSGFLGGSATSTSPLANCERTVNFYAERIDGGAAKSRLALYPTPGFSSFVTVDDTGGRALATMNDVTLAVVGNSLYQVSAGRTATKYGTVAKDEFLAQIAFNGIVGNQALIASGGNAYCLNLSTHALTTVLTGEATQIGMLDGYFIALNPSTSKIRLSDLNDGLTWDATQYAQRGDAADSWQAMLINAPDIWLIGSETGVVWYDAGTYPFPFAPRPGAAFKHGIAARWSLTHIGETVLWLSQTAEGEGIIVEARGYIPERVSTSAVESALAGYSTITDAEAIGLQWRGHNFYVLRFPTADATWAFDLDTRIWHEWGKWLNSESRYEVWAPRVHAPAFHQHLVGDATGTISVLDASVGTELDGSEIRRLRRAPGPFAEHRQIPIRRFEVYLEPGLGVLSGQGSNPQLMLRTSDDGSKTWGPERWAAAGARGQYSRLVRWHRLGVPRDRVSEIVMSDPIPWRLIDAWVNHDAPAG